MNASFWLGHARLKTIATVLTGLGVLPFAVLLALILLPSGPSWILERAVLIQALTLYAAVILAFLGGIHWGQGLVLDHPRRLILAVLPALYAWLASLLPWPGAGWMLAAGFLFMLGVDLSNQISPRWYRLMRSVVSVIVVAHLGAAAALTSNPQPRLKEETVMTKNVLGTDLQLCSSYPRTGFYRNGRCETGPDDWGRHTVCAVVTETFLEFTLQRGNDLITPRPDYNFPGLNPGDRWCLCALRWKEALEAGVAPPVILEATHETSLAYVTLDDLKRHAWSPQPEK